MKLKIVALSLVLINVSAACSKKMNFDGSPLLPAHAANVGSTNIETVCDALSGGSNVCSEHQGLRGSIFVLAADEGAKPENMNVDSYILKGAQLPVQIQLSHLDVAPRDFTAGFPLSDGTVLSDTSGNPVLEYFGLDLAGFFQLSAAYPSGEYEFAEYTDDGSVLYLDGQVLVNDDGTHSPRWACSQAIQLNSSDRHTMRLKYYQGPRTAIALNVYMRPAKKDGVCDESGGWIVIPPEMLSN